MKKFRFIIGIAVSVFFLYLVFRRVNLGDTARILVSTDILYVLLSALMIIPTLLVRSFRWRSMLDDYRKFPLMNYFESISVGIMSSNLLPLRAGDFIQVFFLGYKTKLSKSSIFSTVILERLCDFFTLCVVLIGGSFFVLLPQEISVGRIGLFLAVILAGVFFAVRSRKSVLVLVSLLPAGVFKERIAKIAENFYLGLNFINRKDVLLKIMLATVLVWICSSLGIYLCLLAIGIKLNLFSCMFILSLMGLASMIPVSPGYVGPLS